MERSYAISFCRVISMIMIILCHIIPFYSFIPGNSFLGQVFNCAVYTFIGISGFLYGKKNIGKFSKWIKDRVITIGLPTSLFSALVLLIRIIMGVTTPLSAFVVYPFCLKGLSFIFPSSILHFPDVPVLGPLWFVTIIIICYCLVPLCEKIREYNCNRKGTMVVIIGCVFVSFFLQRLCSINISYFVVFVACYFLSAQNEIEFLKAKPYVAFSFIVVILQLIRLLLHHFFDETNSYEAYVSISQSLLGIWVLVSVIFLFDIVKVKPLLHRFVNYLDGLSFYIYIVHGCFFRGGLNAFEITSNLLLQTIFFLSLSFISAIVLRFVSKKAMTIFSK